MTDVLVTFCGVLAALMFDRVLAATFGVWVMRRIGKHLTKNLDAAIARQVRAQADDVRREPRKRAN